MIKLPCSFNIQNNNWNEIKHHVNRTFLDEKTGTEQDDNLQHIDPKLSKYNLSTDGMLINNRYIYSNQLNNKRLKKIDEQINKTYKNYIKAHNSSKSAQRNKSRQIKDIFKEKLLDKKPSKTDLKKDKNNKNKLNVFERTTVQNIGNTDINNKIINEIKRYKHENYKRARVQFLKAGSEALYLNGISIHKRHPTLIPLHVSTNVDEVIGKGRGLEKSDAIHAHSSILGTSWTRLNNKFKPVKSSKPSFSFARAICQDEKIKYSNKRIKINANNKNGYKLVNKSLHLALSKFRKQEGIHQTLVFNKILKNKLHINFNLKYIQTGQKQNNKSMEQKRKSEDRSHKKLLKKKRIKKLSKIKAQKRRKNTLNRRRNYHKDYMKHKRAVAKLKAKATKAQIIINKAHNIKLKHQQTNNHINSPFHYQLPKATPELFKKREKINKIHHQKQIKEFNKKYSLKNYYKRLTRINRLEEIKSKRIEKQNHIIKLNQMRIKYQQSMIHRLSSKFSAVLGKYKRAFTNIADDTIKSTAQAIKQTEFQQTRRATTTVHNKFINKAVQTLRNKAKAEPNTFFGKIKKNYYSNKANKKSSEALQSLNNSVAKPIQQKHDSWVSERDSLTMNANNLNLEPYQKMLKMNKEKPPMNSEQFSNAIQSATGLNLIQYSTSASASKSASYSQAEPIKEARHNNMMKSLNHSLVSKSEVVHKKQISLENSEQSKQHFQDIYRYRKQQLFNIKFKNSPSFRAKVRKIRNERNMGPQR